MNTLCKQRALNPNALIHAFVSQPPRPDSTMSHQLTAGFIKRVSEPGPLDEQYLAERPTVQILSYKKVDTGANTDRYRVIVSDGLHFQQWMFATQLNHLIDEQKITKDSIVIIEEFLCNQLQGKK